MGFLDDLKRQAEATKARQSADDDKQGRNAGLTDMACKTASNYFAQLVQQLNVLRPRSKVTYRLDRTQRFADLPLVDFRSDARTKRLRGAEACDHVVLRWRIASAQPLAITKNFVPDIESFESRLRRGGVRYEAHEVRHAETAKLREMRYEFIADFNASVLITPDHDAARLHFELVNLDGFETVTVDFPAFEVGSTRLDDLAHWVLGEPNAFLKGGQNLRRVEA